MFISTVPDANLVIYFSHRILYDFHQKQTSKKAGSVHATYLVSGVQVVKPASNGVHQTDEDTPMQSSPFMSSSMPNQDVEEEATGTRVMTLAREEHLEGIGANHSSPKFRFRGFQDC